MSDELFDAVYGSKKQGNLFLKVMGGFTFVVVLVGTILIVRHTMANAEKKALELELRTSFKMFLETLEQRDGERLNACVYFPGVQDYPEHVKNLLLTYLKQLQSGEQITFDDQGVVLNRFLKLKDRSFEVKEITFSEDKKTLSWRIGFGTAYDNNLTYNTRGTDFPQGTTFYIPGKPWGKVIPIVLGGEVPVPREQVSYVEIEMDWHRTNYKGIWQLRRCKVDESKIRYEKSIKADFS